ncbi:DGQHR domain-containing protein [Anaerosporobacter faecicola]|uniref:DGQHR domain-containing protein n=1 Tax=Anaerosporobacter faecicola TaxID=2718714 RepID=UPI00143A6008|nr:DGQHR domain-containing protein [Anaerosporobacter faecicola]
MNSYRCLEYKQMEQECYILVLPFSVINRVSEILIYGESKYGYQRALNTKHFKKIANSIKKKELISPATIILGANKSTLDKIIEKEDEENYTINFESLSTDEKLRVIDGQHRLAGVREIYSKDPTFEYNFSVAILAIEDDKRSVEVEIFRDINSKAKPIKSDLPILALYNYELIEKNVTDIRKHVCINAAYKLNNDENSVWMNAIKLDINSADSVGIVGFKTFYESITKICDVLVIDETIKNESFEQASEYIEKYADKLANEILKPCWETVKKKWSDCFSKNSAYYNYEEVITEYDKKYYIQKTMGCKSINGLLSDEIAKNPDMIEKGMDSFENIINESKLTCSDWESGGKFAGLSSEAGFKQIRNLIKNDEK